MANKTNRKGNPQYLKSFNTETEEERQRMRECSSKGGKASVEARRRKKLMRENLEILCQLPAKGGRATDVESIKNFAELKGKNITVEQAMLIAQIKKALGGDTTALTFIRDTMGQKPVEQAKVETNSTEASLLAEIVGQLKPNE